MPEEKPATAGEPVKEQPPKPAKERQAPLAMENMEMGEEDRSSELMPKFKTFGDIFQYCNWVAESSIVPEAYRGRPADVFVAAQYGHEIGLRFMTAIQNIAIIGGKPALPSDIKLAMVRGLKLLEYKREATIEEIKKTGIAWCEMKRFDVKEPERHTFSIDDAKVAGVWEKLGRNNFAGPWVTHKWRMLQLKPRDMCLRDLFGDVYKGLASIEEAQEIEMINEAKSAQVLIEAASQPGTKGKEILEAARPPLKPEPEPSVQTGTVAELFPNLVDPPVGLARPSQGGQEEGVLGTAPIEVKKKEPEPPKEQPPKEPEPSEQESKAEAEQPPDPAVAGALARQIDERSARLRAMPAGGPALARIWADFKVPMKEFGRISPTTVLTPQALGLFNEALAKALISMEEAAAAAAAAAKK